MEEGLWEAGYLKLFDIRNSEVQRSSVLSDAQVVPEYCGKSSHRFPYKNQWHIDPNVVEFCNAHPMPFSRRFYQNTKGIEQFNFQNAEFSLKAAQTGFAKYFVKRPDQSLWTNKEWRAWEKSWEFIRVHVGMLMRGSAVLTHEEFLDVYTKTTSNGVGFNKDYPTKEDFVKECDGLLRDYWHVSAQYPVNDTIYAGNLKSELLPREKIELHKTRAFLGASILENYCSLRLFYDMNNRFHDSAAATWSYTGMSPWKGNWNRIFERLQRFPNPFSLDGKNWDGSISWFLFGALALFRYDMLRKKDQTMDNWMRILSHYHSVCFGLVALPDGWVVRKEGGMPSGTLNTIDDNSIINILSLVFSFYLKYPDAETLSVLDHIEAIVCGDDQTFSSDPMIFNDDDVIKGASLLGIKFEKNVEVGPTTWDNLEFCSTYFKDCRCGKCAQKVNHVRFEKLFCSMMLDERPTLSLAIEKASNMLPLAWPDREAYEWFSALLIYLIRKTKYPKDFMHYYHTPSKLYAMYHGYEARKGVALNNSSFKRCLQNTIAELHRDLTAIRLYQSPLDSPNQRSLRAQLNAIQRLLTLVESLKLSELTDKQLQNLLLTVRLAMGRVKLLNELNSGKITKEQYNERLKQSQMDKKAKVQSSTSARSSSSGRKVSIEKAERLPISENTRKMLTGAIGSNAARMSQEEINYAAALIFPEMFKARVPDSDVRPTILVQDLQIYELSATTNYSSGAENNGRGGIVLQGILGSPDQPSNYGNLIPDNITGWPSDFSEPGAYLSEVGGKDPRISTYQCLLTQPQNGFYSHGSNGTGSSDAILFGTAPVYSELNFAYGDVYQDGSSGWGFYPPPGMYIFMGVVTGTGLGTVSFTQSSDLGIFPLINLDMSTDVDIMVLIIVANGSSNFFSVQSTAISTVTSTFASLTPIFTANSTTDPQLIAPMNYGPAVVMRLAEMSGLFTYMGPLLNNGGMISAAWLPPRFLEANYIVDTFGSGIQQSYWDWENLAQAEGAYNGELKDGAYVWWSPADITNTEFSTPSDQLNANYPIIGCSFQWNPGNAVPSTPVIRAKIVKTWEIITPLRAWDQERCVGSQAMLDRVNQLYADLPHAMANATHQGILNRALEFAKKGIKFYKQNASTINPILAKAGTLALSMI